MTRANWKPTERAVAQRFGVTTTRNSRPGTWEDAGDIALPGWVIDVKAHESKAWRVRAWWEDVERKARAGDGDHPALVLKRPGLRLDFALVVVRLAELATLAARLEPVHDDELGNVTDDVAYECGYHDGIDYGYRLAVSEVRPLLCERCAGALRAMENAK